VIGLLAAVAGCVGGIYGIGGGSILSPILVADGQPASQVAPAALSSTFLTSLAGVVTFSILSLHQQGSVAPDWRTGIALGAFLANGALLAGFTLRAFVAVGTLVADRTLLAYWAFLASGALVAGLALGTLVASQTLVAVGTFVPDRTLIARGTLVPGRTLVADRTLLTLETLVSARAFFALGAGGSGRTGGTSGTAFGFGAKHALAARSSQERGAALAALAVGFRRDQANRALVRSSSFDAEVDCVSGYRLGRCRCQQQACEQAHCEAEHRLAQAKWGNRSSSHIR